MYMYTSYICIYPQVYKNMIRRDTALRARRLAKDTAVRGHDLLRVRLLGYRRADKYVFTLIKQIN